jgi:hypothetical protein
LVERLKPHLRKVAVEAALPSHRGQLLQRSTVCSVGRTAFDEQDTLAWRIQPQDWGSSVEAEFTACIEKRNPLQD